MNLAVTWHGPARRGLRRLDSSEQRRVVAAVDLFAETGQGDVVKLTDVRPPQYRLRVGPWRVRFLVDREAGVLQMLHVRHRSKAYR